MTTPGSDLLGKQRSESVPRASVRTRGRSRGAREALPSSALVWAFVFFLAIDYLRPPLLQALRLQMLFVLVVPLLWLFSKDRPWSTVLTLQASFIATGAIMLPFARNNYEVYLNAHVMFTHFVTALAVVWLMGSHRKYFHRVIWSYVLVMCIQAIYAITHAGRGYGAMLSDENDLAIACAMVFPFGFVGFQQLKGKLRWLSAIVATLMLSAVVVSLSRGGFLGLAAGGVYCVLFGRHPIRNLLIGGIAAAIFFGAPSAYRTEMETMSETTSGTAEQRLFLWTTAAGVWLDHPILGVGPYNAKGYLGEYQPRAREGELFGGDAYQRDYSGTSIHSVYFELLAERGIVGIGLFAAIAVLHLRILRRLRRDARAGIIPHDRRRDALYFSLVLEAAMLGFLAAGAFLSMASYPHFWFLSALAAALDRWVRRGSSARPLRRAAA